MLSVTMVPLLLVTGAVIVVFSVRMEPLFRVVQQKLDTLNTVVQENITGVRLVKSFARADHETARFETANTALAEKTVQVMEVMSAMTPALTVFINIGTVLVIWLGGIHAVRGTLTVGQIVAFANYLLATMNPLIMMTQLSNTWANGFASAKRINEVLDTEPDIHKAPTPLTLKTQKACSVEFSGVSFHYNGNSALAVLEQISFKAEPGETIAILGATGSGKSTLVNLIPRFYDAIYGTVRIDGYDVRSISEDSLLEHIRIVPQETVLFSGSVRDNIRYGCPDADDEALLAAAKAAQAHDFILRLPHGYETRIEERGVNLSGGQKQRIAIARAILPRPSILILDDSTSAVDVETETKIQGALSEFNKNCTCFIVAQRISTVLNADRILVIDKGRIVAEGKHSELIKSSIVYKEIYDSQLGGGFHA